MKEVKTEAKKEKKATFGMAVLVMGCTVAILLTGVLVLKQDPHIPLLTATIPISLYGLYLNISWNELMDSAYKSITECMEAAILVLTIGMVVGAWIASGTVPFIVYWGVKVLSPVTILPLTLVLTATMSTLTGSSWTTVGTLGVAFMGIGTALGINPAMVVGAVVCGAFWGNAQSPLADVPVFSEAVANVKLYKGTKASMAANVPALIITFVIFLVVGLQSGTKGSVGALDTIEPFLNGLQANYNLTPIVMVPVIVMVIMMVLKCPAIPIRFAAAFTGVACAVFLQHETLADSIGYMLNGFVSNTGIADVDNVLTRGGLMGMTGTIVIMIFSMWMAGLIHRTGIMEVILEKVADVIRRPSILVGTTTITTLVFSYVAADPFLAVTLPAKAYGKIYDELKLDRSIMCRSISMAAYFAPMVPWGSGGIFVAATLGVPVMKYLPYYYVAFLAPIIAIVLAMVGVAMPKKDETSMKEDKETVKAEEKGEVLC